MTTKRDLKRRIRERQEKTGERYTTARAHLLEPARAPDHAAPNWVVELCDVSTQSHAAELCCSVRLTAALRACATDEALKRIFQQLRQILSMSPASSGLVPLQRAVLHGEFEPPFPSRPTLILASELQSFLTSLRQGLRGPGPGGRVVAFDVDLAGSSRTVVAQLISRHAREPLLVLSLFPDEGVLSLFDLSQLPK